MTIWRKIRNGLLIAAVLTGLTAQTVMADDTAANASEYTYTVTLSGGNQGAFNGTTGMSTTSSSAKIAGTGEKIIITGLKLGDHVTLDAAQTGAVTLTNAKYYVRGVRESGRDNSTVSWTDFTVTGDADYVVAYGMKGTTVSYTVNYQDTSGTALAPSRTYYGNVGDRPVVAYLYIDGYQPNAYNITATLKDNAASNVFNFVYSPVPVGQTITVTNTTTSTVTTETTVTNTTTAGTAGTTGGTTGGTTNGTANGTTNGTANGTTNNGTINNGTTNNGTTNNGTTNNGTANNGTTNNGTAGTQSTTTISNEQVPQGIISVPDDSVPLAGGDTNSNGSGSNIIPIVMGVGVSVASAILLLSILLFYLKKKRQKH